MALPAVAQHAAAKSFSAAVISHRTAGAVPKHGSALGCGASVAGPAEVRQRRPTSSSASRPRKEGGGDSYTIPCLVQPKVPFEKFLWGPNGSDGEPKAERIALQFTSKELAVQFKVALDEAKVLVS